MPTYNYNGEGASHSGSQVLKLGPGLEIIPSAAETSAMELQGYTRMNHWSQPIKGSAHT